MWSSFAQWELMNKRITTSALAIVLIWLFKPFGLRLNPSNPESGFCLVFDETNLTGKPKGLIMPISS